MRSYAMLMLTLSAFLLQAHGSAVQQALDFISSVGDKKYNQELLDLAAIPSIASLPEHSGDIEKAARWLVKRLKSAGFEGVQVLKTEQQPAVYAEWLHARSAPTILIYGHYDVQPVDPLNLWTRPPFEPYIKDGRFWGRGISDDKGGLLAPIQAVEAYLKSSKALPVNIKIILEGQEEIGSPNMQAFLAEHSKLLTADFVVSADGDQISRTQGGIPIALRGATAFDVEAKTLNTDVHSGTFGGSVQNANVALATFVSQLHLANGSVAIPGFYDAVAEPTEEDRADAAKYPEDESAQRKRIGATEPVGEAGFTTLERTWLRPTCETIGMVGGFTGTGVKTIVPAKATAKFVCRLVPNQDPDAVLKAAEAYVNSVRIPGTKLSLRKLGFSGLPYLMPRDTLGNRAAAKVLEEELGKKALFYRMGGSIPATGYFKQFLDIYTTVFAFGLEENNVHAPDESYPLSSYQLGRRAYVKILHEIAAASGVQSPAGGTTAEKEEL